MPLAAGQTVYVRYNYRRSEGLSPRKVLKVGRRWVTIENDSFDIETLALKGDPSPGRVYFSEKDYLDELAVDKAWSSFHRQLDCFWRAPKGLTVEKIRQAAELLGIPLD